MGEFELIQRYFSPLAKRYNSVSMVLGPGDDCAIQRVPEGHDLVFSVDTMVEGVHFPQNYSPAHLGWRALAAAASDLAAMGAIPICYTLALTLPAVEEPWLAGFSQGLSDAGQAFGLALAGGDTTRGPLTLSLQVHGVVRKGYALRRGGATVGDLICVSGTLGDAGAALDYLAELQPTPDMAFVLGRYHQPQPRLALGQSLVGIASSCIDISDGLKADLGHILDASGTGATIDPLACPLSQALRNLKGAGAVDYALSAGDDYELCATISPDNWQKAPESVRRQLTVIGAIEGGHGLQIAGNPASNGPDATGFDHFGRPL
jgi:thiamine-monophosphate kinase